MSDFREMFEATRLSDIVVEGKRYWDDAEYEESERLDKSEVEKERRASRLDRLATKKEDAQIGAEGQPVGEGVGDKEFKLGDKVGVYNHNTKKHESGFTFVGAIGLPNGSQAYRIKSPNGNIEIASAIYKEDAESNKAGAGGEGVAEGKLLNLAKLPEDQIQALVEDEQGDMKASATAEVGDGKEPNKFWVSISNDYMADGEGVEDEEASSGYKMLGVVDSFLKAKSMADNVDLDGESGPRRILIEDRKMGMVYERGLEKVTKPSWKEYEIDDSSMLENKHKK